jgi:hypothetical protein
MIHPKVIDDPQVIAIEHNSGGKSLGPSSHVLGMSSSHDFPPDAAECALQLCRALCENALLACVFVQRFLGILRYPQKYPWIIVVVPICLP